VLAADAFPVFGDELEGDDVLPLSLPREPALSNERALSLPGRGL
jgi:hypothetical protein